MRCSYNDIKDNDKFVRFYTGCQNKKVFNCIVNKIKGKAQNSITLEGKETPRNTKKHQENRKHKKGGKKSMLNVEDLLLLTYTLFGWTA